MRNRRETFGYSIQYTQKRIHNSFAISGCVRWDLLLFSLNCSSVLGELSRDYNPPSVALETNPCRVHIDWHINTSDNHLSYIFHATQTNNFPPQSSKFRNTSINPTDPSRVCRFVDLGIIRM